jgi:hypothetical protein
MEWAQVGDWLKANGGTGAALVGSLLAGLFEGRLMIPGHLSAATRTNH